MLNPLNTHTYDGKLNTDLLPDLISMNQLTLNQKQERGKELIIAANKLHPNAIAYLTNIVASMGTPANLDLTNILMADDLICLCWLYREDSDFMSVLETQLLDMNTGFCPQGRTHRLFQTLMAFM